MESVIVTSAVTGFATTAPATSAGAGAAPWVGAGGAGGAACWPEVSWGLSIARQNPKEKMLTLTAAFIILFSRPVQIAKAQAGNTSDLVPRGSQPASSTPLSRLRSAAQRKPSLQAGAISKS